jgi:DNA-binding NtrC family response regulator
MARILLFERQAELRKLLRMLFRADYDLIEAGDVEGALKTARESAEPLVGVVGD